MPTHVPLYTINRRAMWARSVYLLLALSTSTVLIVGGVLGALSMVYFSHWSIAILCAFYWLCFVGSYSRHVDLFVVRYGLLMVLQLTVAILVTVIILPMRDHQLPLALLERNMPGYSWNEVIGEALLYHTLMHVVPVIAVIAHAMARADSIALALVCERKGLAIQGVFLIIRGFVFLLPLAIYALAFDPRDLYGRRATVGNIAGIAAISGVIVLSVYSTGVLYLAGGYRIHKENETHVF